ncbi:MAG TPA: response regulator [Pedobacter sp.]|jgi:DNA-binding response OmpR family regulator
MSKKVALVENDEDCREIMQYVLEEDGYEVQAFKSYTMLNRLALYDLFIIDEYSPGIRGSDVCKELKSQVNIPVILSSTGLELYSSACACGADTYLSKPFDIDYLRSLVKRYINLDVRHI